MAVRLPSLANTLHPEGHEKILVISVIIRRKLDPYFVGGLAKFKIYRFRKSSYTKAV